MIKYNPGKWSIFFACSLRGSVFPRAFVLALPCSLLSAGLHVAFKEARLEQAEHAGPAQVQVTLLAGYTFILGFLIVFRSTQAYSRWWEGAMFLQQMRGEWFNAFSNLVAFCNMAPGKKTDVQAFQHRLARLFSLLYCTAIQQVSTMKVKNYELIDIHDFDAQSMRYLLECPDRCEICLQWIQKLVVDSADSQTLKVPPPILSRVYNQLGNGIVILNNARKITEFPIPFPLAQMITIMLLCHWAITASVCATALERPHWAAILAFMVTFSFWSINYIAVELEQPYGDDANDLPLHHMQIDMNKSLEALLHVEAQNPPDFFFGEHHLRLERCHKTLEDIFGSHSHKVTQPMSCIDDNTAGQWSTPDMEKESNPASPAIATIHTHCTEPPFSSSMSTKGCDTWEHKVQDLLSASRSSQCCQDLLSASPSSQCCQEHASKDQPVQVLPTMSVRRTITLKHVPPMPCVSALRCPQGRQTAPGNTRFTQLSCDSWPAGTHATQAQEGRTPDWLRFGLPPWPNISP